MKKIKLPLLLLITYFNYTFVFNKIYNIHFFSIYVISLLILLLNYKSFIKLINLSFKYKFINIFLLYLLILLWALIYPVFLNTYDFSYLNTLLSISRNIVKGMAILVIFIRVHKEEANFDLFAKYLIAASIIYVSSTVLFYVFPSFKTLWMELIYDSERNKQLSLQTDYIMRYGLVGFSGFQQTFMMSLSSMLNIFLIIKVNNKKENWWKLALTLAILFLGNTFYGRIGLLTTMLGILFLIIYLSFKRITNILKLGLFLGILISVFVFLYKNISGLQNWFNWAFALFINYKEFGSWSTGSSEHLFTSMYFKIPQRTFLFGDGYYTNPITNSYYMNTDVGFMRPILFYGIIFTTFGYLILINILLGMKKSFNNLKVKEGVLLLLLLLGTTIAFELKGEIFYKMIGLLIPFYFILIYEEYLLKNKLKE